MATFVVTRFILQLGKLRLRKEQGGPLALAASPAHPTLQLSAGLYVNPCTQEPGLTGSLDVLG